MKNKYIGKEIIEIVNASDEIIETFLTSGINDLIITWIQNIETWAEKNSDEEILEATHNFIKWKDKEELKKLISLIKNRHKIYLSSQAINKNVFIAHNDGDPIAQETQKLLHKENFYPIIMQEHPSIGKTVIEKLKSFDFCIGVIILNKSWRLASKNKNAQTNLNVVMDVSKILSL